MSSAGTALHPAPAFRVANTLRRTASSSRPGGGGEDPAGRFTPADFERRFDLSRNPKQAEFVYSPAKFNFYVGGVGAGKTFAGALRAVNYALGMPGSIGVIGAPTYMMLTDATAREFFNVLPPAAIAQHNRGRGVLTLTNGSEIFFRSMDNPDRLRGIEIAWFWLDEAPYCSYYSWTVAKGRLRQQGFPGWGWATGTPRGKDGFYYDFEGKRKKGHHLFRASTHANAHNLPPGYIEGLDYAGSFYKQEIEGLFTAYEGLVYAFDEAIHVGHLKDPRQRVRTIGGIDWGYKNPSVLLPIALDGDDRAYVLDEFYASRKTIDDICEKAIAMTRRYGVEVWYAGPDEPEHIETLRYRLQRDGLSCRVMPADNSIIAGIQTVTTFLTVRDDGRAGLYIHASNCPQTLSEFGQYAYKEPNKRLRNVDEKPEKVYDHSMDALRYALHSVYGAQGRRGQHALQHLKQRKAHREKLDRQQKVAAQQTYKIGPVSLDEAGYF